MKENGLFGAILSLFPLRKNEKSAPETAQVAASTAVVPAPKTKRRFHRGVDSEYSGGPVFGPWDPSVHLASGQLQRFGRAAYSDFSAEPFKPGIARVTGSKGDIYLTSLENCTCPDFERRGLPCKHIYGLALSLGYTADDFYSCYLSAACNDGSISRPEIGYSVGLSRYQVHGKNPATGRQNKRFVFALDESDAVSAAREIGLDDPIRVAGVVPSEYVPLEEYQKEVLQQYDIALPPSADWEDGQALLRRLDTDDVSVPVGLFKFAVKAHHPCSLLSGADLLLGQFSHKLAPHDRIALYAAAVLCLEAGQSLTDCSSDPVTEACRAFASHIANDERQFRAILNRLTVQELKKPSKKSSAYKAVLDFCLSR